MSRFHDGEYEGLKFSARPTGWREKLPINNYIYWVGDRPEFYINIIDNPNNINPEGIILEKISGTKQRIISKERIKKISDNRYLIKGYYIPGEGDLVYWFSVPNHEKGAIIAEFRGIWKYQIQLILLTSLISASVGFLVGLLGITLIGLIK